MPKRKPPLERRVWARLINHEWRVTLVDGEVLTPVRDLERGEVGDLARNLPTFLIGFLEPVRALTGDADAISAEIGRITVDGGIETNRASLFRGSVGTEAVVLEHRH